MKKQRKCLNQRQWVYLQAVFDAVFDQEQQEKAAGCWILYNAAGSPLLERLQRAGVRDPGTGSTFAALERRGLVRCRYQWGALGVPILAVQLTQEGRRLVRQARGIAPARWPVGMLREWHWRALCRAWSRGEQGMGYHEDLQDGFGYVSWKTCLRLLNYRSEGRYRPLLREGCRKTGEPGLFITEEGKLFYQEHWQVYRQHYPLVPAPPPGSPPSR